MSEEKKITEPPPPDTLPDEGPLNPGNWDLHFIAFDLGLKPLRPLPDEQEQEERKQN